MVELVDTRVLEARTSGVRVQVPLPAPVQKQLYPYELVRIKRSQRSFSL